MSKPPRRTTQNHWSRRGKRELARKGGIVAGLQRFPLVGADLDLKRPRGGGRKVKI